MGLLTISEAAVRCGFSIELLNSLTQRCPKSGQTRVLASQRIDEMVYVDERELDAYVLYLREPWPKTKSGDRPRVPDAIARDVREECHQLCAICGDMNNGEVAHIDPVADTLDNSPDNLLFLCPNHHTQYDYGHFASNVDREGILAAKRVKRMSRRRMLRYEGNVAGTLRTVLRLVTRLAMDLRQDISTGVADAYRTELQALLERMPEAIESAQKAAETNRDFAEAESALLEIAPQLFAATVGAALAPEETVTTASSVMFASEGIIDLDEVTCPHCAGRGTTGLMGRLCSYCDGDQVVSEARAADYDRNEIDEVECPHCHGRGQTGLRGSVCSYCSGDCVVSTETAETYDRDEIDEVECPHCHGRGQTGLSGAVCAYCDGDQVVSSDAVEAYGHDEIDEVECPRCRGRGTIGLNMTMCPLCGGDQVVTSARARAFRTL